MKKKLNPLPWYGGKQAQGKAKWIASILPWEKKSTYAELFGGMGSVLLNREPVNCEIFNDLDKNVINWWRVVREQREKFGRALECLPCSEDEFQKAKIEINNDDLSPFDRALAFHCLISQAYSQNMNNLQWRTRYHYSSSVVRWRSERVALLAERMWKVQLFCRPAERILEKLIDKENMVIYCDPPYRTRDTSAYSFREVNVDLLTELFNAQKGSVAISGVDDEWDHLGWERHEKATVRTANPDQKIKVATPLVEVLWTNFSPKFNVLNL